MEKEEDSTTVEKGRCKTCKHFLRASDPHPLYFICRPCQPDQPCELDQDWSNDQWAEVEAKRNEKAARKASSTPNINNPALAKFIEDAINKAMEGVSTRLAVIEQEIHGEKLQVRYFFLSLPFVHVSPMIYPTSHSFFVFLCSLYSQKILPSFQHCQYTHRGMKPWTTGTKWDIDG